MAAPCTFSRPASAAKGFLEEHAASLVLSMEPEARKREGAEGVLHTLESLTTSRTVYLKQKARWGCPLEAQNPQNNINGPGTAVSWRCAVMFLLYQVMVLRTTGTCKDAYAKSLAI